LFLRIAATNGAPKSQTPSTSGRGGLEKASMIAPQIMTHPNNQYHQVMTEIIMIDFILAQSR